MNSNTIKSDELKQQDLEKNKKKLENGQHNAFLYIPAYVADNPNIDDGEIVLFGRLNALSNRKGYCYATNEYLADLTKISVPEIKKRLKTLEDQGVIKRFTKRKGMGWDRKIYTCNNYSQIISMKDRHGSLEGSPRILAKDPHGSHNNISNNNINRKEVASKDALLCSKYLFEKLKKLRKDRKEPNWELWAREEERMIRLDGLTKEDILKMIDWLSDTDNTFIVNSMASLRRKRENIADHMAKQINKKIEATGSEGDPRLAKAFGILKEYLSVINDGMLANNLSLRLDDKTIYHTVHKYNSKKTYEKFIEILKINKAPPHLLGRMQREAGNIVLNSAFPPQI